MWPIPLPRRRSRDNSTTTASRRPSERRTRKPAPSTPFPRKRRRESRFPFAQGSRSKRTSHRWANGPPTPSPRNWPRWSARRGICRGRCIPYVRLIFNNKLYLLNLSSSPYTPANRFFVSCIHSFIHLFKPDFRFLSQISNSIIN